MTTKPWLLFALLRIISCYRACFSISGDTLSPGQSLSVTDTIVSNGGTFELGFFQPGTSLKIYLGIWYKRFVPKEVVWVANRETPLSDPSSSRLDLSDEGNLLLFQGSSWIPFWSTNLTFSRSNLTEAVLGEDGNLVLRDGSNQTSIFWESFNHPTDTLLPGSKLWIKKLISWKNSEDPAPGMFSLGLDPNGSNQYFLEWNRSQIYWSTGVWNGRSFSLVPEMNGLSSIINYTFAPSERYFTYSLRNPSYISKYRIDYRGQLRQLAWLFGPWEWSVLWSAPRNLSGVFALCGAFGVLYHENSSNPCECLKGFQPFSINYTRISDWSGGCVRKSPLQCENNTYANATKDWFVKVPNMRLPANSKAYPAVSAMNCDVACMNNCTCTAYAYNKSGCMVWEGALLNLQQLSEGDETGQDIYLKLAADELQSTKGEMKSTIFFCHLSFRTNYTSFSIMVELINSDSCHDQSGKKWKVWVAVLVPTTWLILCLFICFSCKGKSKRLGNCKHTFYCVVCLGFQIVKTKKTKN
jgi:hypothetical protein